MKPVWNEKKQHSCHSAQGRKEMLQKPLEYIHNWCISVGRLMLR
jgi:hypothetical protein